MAHLFKKKFEMEEKSKILIFAYIFSNFLNFRLRHFGWKIPISVTKLGDLLDFWQLFKAFCDN